MFKIIFNFILKLKIHKLFDFIYKKDKWVGDVY